MTQVFNNRDKQTLQIKIELSRIINLPHFFIKQIILILKSTEPKSVMFTRHSINSKRPALRQLNSENNEKENNQKNLNRIKKSARVDPTIAIKPLDPKNYSTNADTKLNVSLNYNSINPTGEFRSKVSSRTSQRHKLQFVIPPSKYKSNTQQFCDLYGKDILISHQLNPSYRKDFLKNHEIDPSLRARMLDWMVEVMQSYKFDNKAYFSGVELMDRYFAQSKEKVPVSQLHILGVTAMYIATKMQEVYPLKIKTVYEKVVHKKISKEELMEMEKRVFEALGHRVNCWTIFDLALLKIHEQLQIQDSAIKQKLEKVTCLISKCIIYDYELYLRYNTEALASVIAKMSSKICRLPLQKEIACQKQCYDAVINCYKDFKSSFKGLNNIFKFTDESILKLLDSFVM